MTYAVHERAAHVVSSYSLPFNLLPRSSAARRTSSSTSGYMPPKVLNASTSAPWTARPLTTYVQERAGFLAGIGL